MKYQVPFYFLSQPISGELNYPKQPSCYTPNL